METNNGATRGDGGLGAHWKGFHQAYDSALRSYRRGPDVARAVNWLYVASREGANAEELESERRFRELGLNASFGAKSEAELAPRVWSALKGGAAPVEEAPAPEEPAPVPEVLDPIPLPEPKFAPDEGGENGDGPKEPEPERPRDPAWEFLL